MTSWLDRPVLTGLWSCRPFPCYGRRSPAACSRAVIGWDPRLYQWERMPTSWPNASRTAPASSGDRHGVLPVHIVQGPDASNTGVSGGSMRIAPDGNRSSQSCLAGSPSGSGAQVRDLRSQAHSGIRSVRPVIRRAMERRAANQICTVAALNAFAIAFAGRLTPTTRMVNQPESHRWLGTPEGDGKDADE